MVSFPQNVWPLLYKPAFSVAVTPPPLLLAMLAAAAVIPAAATSAQPTVPPSYADTLFADAQIALVASHAPSQPPSGPAELHPFRPNMHTVQCLLLFSLRQTSTGNKGSAYMWGCKAFAMALELGLHTAVTNAQKMNQVRCPSGPPANGHGA